MKKIPYLIVVPILALSLYWFFYYFNASFKNKEIQINIIGETEERINIEDYIIGVVACEMPALYNTEALKAQAVASRTYAMNMLSENRNTVLKDTSDQCFIDESEMKQKWGSDYQKYYNIIKTAVNDTANIVMNQDGKLFKSFYFSTSNGSTVSSKSVFNEGSIMPVSSEWDKESKNYQVTSSYTIEELKKILGSFKDITIISRDDTHHILSIAVDNKKYTGVEFRKMLNLRSTDFDIEVKDNKYYITTYGYGHGVGMSQYGANYLASLGYNYEEILKYYYQDISFKIY